MEIPTYQIHKIIKVYTRQLSQSKMLERQKTQGSRSSMDKISISAEGKRQAIIEKVANDVVQGITNFGPKDEFSKEIVDKLEQEIGGKVKFKQNKAATFVFNVIDAENKKTTNTISVKNSDYVLNRLEQLTKEAVNKNMEF